MDSAKEKLSQHFCLECGHAMKAQPVELSGRYRGEQFTITVQDGFACPSCHFQTLRGRASADFSRQLKEEYKRRHGTVDVASLRGALKLSQTAFAELVGVGVASVKRWEAGAVPDRALSDLIRLKMDSAYRNSQIERLERTLITLGKFEYSTSSPTVQVNLSVIDDLPAKGRSANALGRTGSLDHLLADTSDYGFDWEDWAAAQVLEAPAGSGLTSIQKAKPSAAKRLDEPVAA